MNMKYNDYYDFAKKHDKEEDTEFYAEMAKCFVKDMDAKEHKIFNYFM